MQILDRLINEKPIRVIPLDRVKCAAQGVPPPASLITFSDNVSIVAHRNQEFVLISVAADVVADEYSKLKPEQYKRFGEVFGDSLIHKVETPNFEGIIYPKRGAYVIQVAYR